MEFTVDKIKQLQETLKNEHKEELIRYWEKNDMKRYYVKLKPFMFYADIDYYNTGSVRNCTVNGLLISNSMARGLLWALDYGKAYFDIESMEFKTKDIPEYWEKLLVEFIETQLASL